MRTRCATRVCCLCVQVSRLAFMESVLATLIYDCISTRKYASRAPERWAHGRTILEVVDVLQIPVLQQHGGRV